jgi:2-polyprenyl-6-methoxyphenol hydroxylase-like FAD-dependent oxidoreductase
VTVVTEQGEQSFDVLVGADGVYSRVRELLHGRTPVRYSGYRCFRGVATGQFGLGRTMRESWGRGRRLGLVPIGEDRAYWFAVENSAPSRDLPSSDRLAHVLRRFSDFDSPARAVLEATKTEDILQHDLSDRVPLDHWGRGPKTLLGDAAHPMTPNMGQGAGQSIEDAAFLAHAFSLRASGESPSLILRAYEQARLKRANGFVRKSQQLGRVAQLENPVLCWLRNAALWLTPNRVSERSFSRLLESGIPTELPQHSLASAS